MEIKIPALSLVVLVGVSSAGKSSFAKKHFKATEILSSDDFRAMIADDENSLSATPDAFDALHYVAAKRLKNGLLTVIDATNVQPEARKGFIELARKYHVLPVAIVLDMPETLYKARNAARSDRDLGEHSLRMQHYQLKKSLRFLKEEGFRNVFILKSFEEVEAITGIVREPLYNDKKNVRAPFDIIGDVHGCFEELCLLLTKLGYQIERVTPDNQCFGFKVHAPHQRKVIFVGDLVDRGTNTPDVLRLVMSMVNEGKAYCVCGNHDSKLARYLKGKKVSLIHGLEKSAEQLAQESQTFRNIALDFLYNLISHYIFDDGKLVVAHAGLREEMHGRGSAEVRSFCMYGETTGEIDEFGLPVRYNWAKEYRGKAKVVYGHTPIPEPEWLNNTLNIDTGCVFGGKLTALRYPELQVVSVDALQVYCQPVRPIKPLESNLSSQQENDNLLDIEDVTGKRIIQTQLKANITILPQNSIAALEVMSRFAVNPKWLIYLPPTMSPCATSELPNYLEHPNEALDYYHKRGVEHVICEEKHMGSRAVVVMCKDEQVALKRFGIENEGFGVCYTRTGRNFFTNPIVEKEFLKRINEALTKANFWEKHQTEWVCLDAELMPWSAKAQSLIREQYASVGSAAGAALPIVANALQKAAKRNLEGMTATVEKFMQKKEAIGKYVKAYQNYCWDVQTIDDYKFAPFHILATEGGVHHDKTHEWHLTQIADFCAQDTDLLMKTPYKIVNLNDAQSMEAAVNWWSELTEKGGEGMVVKPLQFLAYNDKELLQPAIKCRGSEYLRIIYGVEYDLPENLVRLKNRGLSRKQSLALREFALSMESLMRFVRREPLRRVHESVFGVLALESEEVDPRL